MARRAAAFRFFPFRFEPAKFFEAHEDGVESAGGDSGGLGQGVAVAPFGGPLKQLVKEVERLRGDADAKAHALSLHIWIYTRQGFFCVFMV